MKYFSNRRVPKDVMIDFRYNYDWKIEEAQKNVLRTHTTAVSARQLFKLAQEVRCIIISSDLYSKAFISDL